MKVLNKRSTWIKLLVCIKRSSGQSLSSKRSIYCLKQSSKASYFRFHEALIYFGLNMVSEGHCMDVKKTAKGIIFLALYVENILLAGNSMEMIKTTKQWLSFILEMEDIGEARYVLGVEIIRNYSKKLVGLSKKHTLINLGTFSDAFL